MKLLDDYCKAREIHDKALGELSNELERIVGVIKRHYKVKKDTWFAYGYYESNGEPPLPQMPFDGIFEYYLSSHASNDKFIYSEGFPVEFFSMTNEEIKNYLIEEDKECEEARKIKKEKAEKARQKRQTKNEKLIEQAKSKLNEDELKAIGL